MRRLFVFATACLLIALLAGFQTNTRQMFDPPRSYTVTANNARARACASTTCEIEFVYQRNSTIRVLGTEQGEAVNGNRTWLIVDFTNANTNVDEVFIHSSLARRAGTTGGSTGNTSAASSSNTSGPVSTAVPLPISTPVPAPAGFTCNCSRTCGSMTCTEAYFQLQQCGCSQRDADSDGVPCESICPGG